MIKSPAPKVKRKQITPLQCDLVIKMLTGKYYAMKRHNVRGRAGIMLYEGNQNPVKWYSEKTARILHQVLKHGPRGRITINLNLVRQLDGRSYIKKAYKKSRKTKVTYQNSK